MDPVKLTEELRALPGRIVPDDEQYWLDRIRPQLPEAPFTPAFLEELLAPLSLLEQSDVLDFLARLGRKEVAAFAAVRLKKAEGDAKLRLGTALISCGDARGYAALEELFRHSLDFPDDKPNSVPLGWIYDTLFDEFGHDDAATALRVRLIALENQRRAQRN
jgi:hypothetical protein